MASNLTEPRRDSAAWAGDLAISREAIDLWTASDCIDLHIESFLWTRAFGYDLAKRHGHGMFGARYYSQVDLPRLLESGLTGSVWSIATNPFRRRRRRTPTLLKNLERLRNIFRARDEQFALVADAAGYRQARAAKKHAVWLAIQGGNALDSGPSDLDRIPDDCISRITLVHLTDSALGATSSPLGGDATPGLTPQGADFIRRMNARRILVDLAHISEAGFWKALEVHDASQPAIVSHTGLRGVHDLWRNIGDDQVRAIAATGGVIGILFHTPFLGGSFFESEASLVVDHMERVIRVAGEDYVALGSDWDGLIVTPREMPTVLEIPVLVQRMLDRGWSPERIQKILGGNYLRVMERLRPGQAPARSS